MLKARHTAKPEAVTAPEITAKITAKLDRTENKSTASSTNGQSRVAKPINNLGVYEKITYMLLT